MADRMCPVQMRGTISPANPWDVMVDLFFYREPEDVKEEEAEAAYGAAEATTGYTPALAAAPGEPPDLSPLSLRISLTV